MRPEQTVNTEQGGDAQLNRLNRWLRHSFFTVSVGREKINAFVMGIEDNYRCFGHFGHKQHRKKNMRMCSKPTHFVMLNFIRFRFK